MGLFGKDNEKSSREQIREWTSQIRKECHQLDRHTRAIEREQEKVKKSLKVAAKNGDTAVCKILAKEIVNARKSISRIHTTKTQLNSILLYMNQQFATLRVAGSLEKSTHVMEYMQSLVKVPEIAEKMKELSKEMMKAGIIDEMLEDTFESAFLFEDSDLEEEADKEVENVLWELTAGLLGTAPDVVSESSPASEIDRASTSSAHDTADLTDVQERLKVLRS